MRYSGLLIRRMVAPGSLHEGNHRELARDRSAKGEGITRFPSDPIIIRRAPFFQIFSLNTETPK